MKKHRVSTNCEFVRLLTSISQRYNAWEVWSDFVSMFAIAISNAVDPRYRDAREETYMSIIQKYNEHERPVFPKLVAEVVMALEENPEQDFLGRMFMELNLGDHWKGQFFTPYDICELMAAITASRAVEQIEEKGYITINDCACGAGATLIAGCHAIRDELYHKKSPLCWQNHVLVAAQDLDCTAAMMCYIQLSLLGCAGYVKVGNSLTDPMWEGDDKSQYWYTPMYFSDTWIMRRIIHTIDNATKAS